MPIFSFENVEVLCCCFVCCCHNRICLNCCLLIFTLQRYGFILKPASTFQNNFIKSPYFNYNLTNEHKKAMKLSRIPSQNKQILFVRILF
nr:MAG TPA: hypothetical protein [Caudoviricetes sp.]